MFAIYFSIVLFCGILFSVSAFDWEVYSRYAYFTKRVAPGIFTGGLITTRQIDYLNAAKFGSIISIAYEESDLDEFNGVKGNFPSSMDEIRYAKDIGMDAVNFKPQYTRDSLDQISNAISHMKKPIYLHCHAGYAASLFAELHLYLSGAYDGDDIYNNSITLGWDFASDSAANSFIEEITHVVTPVTPESLELTLANGEESYKYYYWSHRIGNDMWYNIGQVLDTQVQTIRDSGYKSVISFRNNGEGTTRLPDIDPSEGPIDNNEFSDSDGNYNVTAERIAFEEVGVKFYNLPVSGDDAWTSAQLAAYTPIITEAASNGPVLVHCTSGYRSAAYITAYLAQQNNKCTSWALKEARRIGYSFDINPADASVIDFYEDVLGC